MCSRDLAAVLPGSLTSERVSVASSRLSAAQQRLVRESSLRSALETLRSLQGFREDVDPLDPDLSLEYRRFLDATAEYYLLYLSALVDLVVECVSPAPGPVDPQSKEVGS